MANPFVLAVMRAFKGRLPATPPEQPPARRDEARKAETEKTEPEEEPEDGAKQP